MPGGVGTRQSRGMRHDDLTVALRDRSRAPQERRSSPSTPIILIAVLALSIGYGMSLTPAVAAGSLPVLILGAVVLLVGLNQSVREERLDHI